MKFAVTWYDESADATLRREGTIEFDASMIADDGFYNDVENVINAWEDKGVTLDIGGDDDWYEVDLPDHDSSDPRLPEDVLKDLEKILVK